MMSAPAMCRLTSAQIRALPQRWIGHVQVLHWMSGQANVQYEGVCVVLAIRDDAGQITHVAVEGWLELFFVLRHQLHPDGWLVGLTFCVALYDTAGAGPPHSLPQARPVWHPTCVPVSDLAMCAAELAARVRFLYEQDLPLGSRNSEEPRLTYDLTLAKIAFLSEVSVLELDAQVRQQHPHLFQQMITDYNIGIPP